MHDLRNAHGERLAVSFTAGDEDSRDLVLLCHGVTSDKDRPWSEALSAALASEGIASLRLAFSGNGESEGRFEDATISKEVGDVLAVLDALEGWRVGYIGHSMGGAVGLLAACRDRRLRYLVSLAAVTHTAEFVRRMFGHLKPGEAMLDKPHCPYGPALEDDLLALDTLAPRAADVSVPWLVVHGTEDEIVPHQHSVDLRAMAAATCELVLLDGVDHSFSGQGIPRLLETVVRWIVAVCSSEGSAS